MLHSGLYVNDPDMYVSTWVKLETVVREGEIDNAHRKEK